MLEKSKITVIIPVHNRKLYTIHCIESLYSQENKHNIEIIIVDDGSTDGTNNEIKKRFPEVHVIIGDGTWWWTKSCNEGIKTALSNQTELLVLLNNDTIAKSDFIKELIKPINQNHNVITGALGLDADTKKPIQTGQVIKWLTASVFKYPIDKRSSYYQGLKEVTHLPGRGLAFHKKLIDNIGFLNEKDFPQYFADFDYTHKARRVGYQLYCNYDAKLLIYPDESGDLANRMNKSIKNYWNHLFGIKGGGNVYKFIKFALRNCPPKYLPFYLPIGIIRRVTGYWLK